MFKAKEEEYLDIIFSIININILAKKIIIIIKKKKNRANSGVVLKTDWH